MTKPATMRTVGHSPRFPYPGHRTVAEVDVEIRAERARAVAAQIAEALRNG